MSLLDWLRGRASDAGDPASRLYDTIREEARLHPQPLFAELQTLPAGRTLLTDAPPELQIDVLEHACREFCAATQGQRAAGEDYLSSRVIKALVQRVKTVPPHRVAAIFDICATLDGWFVHWLPFVSMLRWVSTPPGASERKALLRLREAVSNSPLSKTKPVLQRIETILNGPDVERMLKPGGTWSARVLGEIATFAPGTRAAWHAVIRHLLDSRSVDRPRKWEKELLSLLDTQGDALSRATFLARALAWLALGPMPDQPTTPQVPERDADYLKGFIWAVGMFDDVATARALADLGAECFRKVPNHGAICARVGNACVRMLGEMPGREAVAQLGRLRTRVKYAVGLRLIAKALASAAAREGLAAEDLEEIAVPTFDFDTNGARQQAFGDCTAHLQIAGTSDVIWSWTTSTGRSQKQVPASVRESHAGDLSLLKKSVKDLLALLPAQRARLERLLESDRVIPYASWRERYIDHPLVGQMSRRLIWHFSDDTRSALGGLDATGDRPVLDVDDQPIRWLSASTAVRLWHPIGHDPELILAWRRWLDRHGVVQPFKQAHREIYLLTDAEIATDTYSNRFAAHVLRQHQFAALCRERGWTYTLQGAWDSANTPARQLPRWNLQARFEVDSPPDARTAPVTQSGVFQYVLTNHVSFYRDDRPVPLIDVPVLAFSELMRDVDLFVGVCSVGNDPTWVDRGPAPVYQDYWRAFSTAALSESAKTRRAVLADLIPRLKIADRLMLEDRFLFVRGDRATYKIHLGSANVLMEPGSRYLCIVPDRRRQNVAGSESSPRGVFLPFEGDDTLALIISKAFLLAADTTITDSVILRQLR